MWIKKISISRFIFLSFMSIAVILILISCLYMYYNSRKTAVDLINKYYCQSINELNSGISLDISKLADTCYFVSMGHNLKRFASEYINKDEITQLEMEYQIMKNVNEPFSYRPDIGNINVFMKDKKVPSKQRNSVYPMELVKDKDWFKRISNLDQSITQSKHEENLHSPGNIDPMVFSINILTAIKNFNNESVGYMNVDINESDIYNRLEKSLMSQRSSVYMIDSGGQVVSAKNKYEIAQPLSVLKNGIELNSRNGGYVKTYIGHHEYLVVYSDLSNMGWRIVGISPVSDIYTGFDNIQYAMIIFGIIFTLFSILMSALFAFYTSKPITELADTMSCTDYSKENISIETDFTNEIGKLYSSYNEANQRIQALIADNRNEQELRHQSEIKTLQAQINPHFLYNTLDSISWSAMKADAAHISEMIVMLSQLLRLSLNGGKSTCPLIKEVEQVILYIELQKTCNVNCFDYKLQIDESTRDLIVPKMILQPLVENSILHGFAHLIEGGLITISSHIIDDELHVFVEDNGCGIPQELLHVIPQKNSKKGGYGIKNVNERIRYLCSSDYGITYYSEIDIKTVAMIKLPIMEDYKESEE